MESSEKVSGGERFPTHFAHKEFASDKITHWMKIESVWDPSPAFVHTGIAIRAGCEETAWPHCSVLRASLI